MFGRLKKARDKSQDHQRIRQLGKQLHEFVSSGDVKKVKAMLAEYGSNSDVINACVRPSFVKNKECHGATPLSVAIRSGHVEIAKLLLGARSVNPNAVDDVYAFLDGNADARVYSFNTPLLAAIEKKQIEIAQVLLARSDVDYNLSSASQQSPLIAAVEHCPALIPLLLAKENLALNSKDIHGRTALHYAVFRHNPHVDRISIEILSMLKIKALNLNVVDGESWTPLMYAAKRNDIAFVNALLDAGARADIKNAAQATAADIAHVHGFEHLANRIRQLAQKKDAEDNQSNTHTFRQ